MRRSLGTGLGDNGRLVFRWFSRAHLRHRLCAGVDPDSLAVGLNVHNRGVGLVELDLHFGSGLGQACRDHKFALHIRMAVTTEDRAGDAEPAFAIRGELDNLALFGVDPLIDVELLDRDSMSNIFGGDDESDVIAFSDRNRLWLEGILSSDHLDFSLLGRLISEADPCA
jgi:hypothetical protein